MHTIYLPWSASTGRPLEGPHALPAMCPHGTLIETVGQGTVNAGHVQINTMLYV